MKTRQFLLPIVVIFLTIVIVFPAIDVFAQIKKLPELELKLQQPGLTLFATPSSEVEAGNTVTFYGYLRDSKTNAIPKEEVLVRSNLGVIGRPITDSNGYYEVTWPTSSNYIGTHVINASAREDSSDEFSQVFQTRIEYVVKAPSLKLTLNAYPLSVTAEEQITFTGALLLGDTSVPGATISIVDRSKPRLLGEITTNAKGEFSYSWETTTEDIGTHLINAVYVTDVPVSFGLSVESTIFATLSSQDVTVNILPVPEIHSLTLDVNPTTITEGEKITFSGSYTSNENPLPSRKITIIDETTNETILATTTNLDGSYLQEWFTTQENIGTLTIYAQSLYDPDNPESQLDISTKQIVTVSSEIPILVLDPLPAEVEEGDIINITGYITSDKFYDNRVRINIEDNPSRFIDRINLDNNFSASWQVTAEDIGTNTIYAECICDEQNLQTSKQTVTVYRIIPPDHPLKVTIISSTTSGDAPLTVTFQPSVSGGSPSYQYDWDVSGIKYHSSVVSHTFHNANESYSVKLTVTDSNQQKGTDEIYITVRDPQRHDPKILVSGTMEEGSEITFTVGGSYPEKVDSYKWDFDDGSSGYNRKVTHSYDDDEQYTVKLTTSDKNGKISTYKTLNIKNKAPEITSLYSGKSEIETNESIRFEGKFIDQGKSDTFNVIWYIDNQEYENKINSIQPVMQNHKFEKSNKYDITLIIRDDDGGQDQETIRIHVKDSFPWILVVAGTAAAGGGAVAAKTLMKPSNSPTPNTDPPSEPPTDPKPIQPTVTVEYRSGIEK